MLGGPHDSWGSAALPRGARGCPLTRRACWPTRTPSAPPRASSRPFRMKSRGEEASHKWKLRNGALRTGGQARCRRARRNERPPAHWPSHRHSRRPRAPLPQWPPWPAASPSLAPSTRRWPRPGLQRGCATCCARASRSRRRRPCAAPAAAHARGRTRSRDGRCAPAPAPPRRRPQGPPIPVRLESAGSPRRWRALARSARQRRSGPRRPPWSRGARAIAAPACAPAGAFERGAPAPGRRPRAEAPSRGRA